MSISPSYYSFLYLWQKRFHYITGTMVKFNLCTILVFWLSVVFAKALKKRATAGYSVVAHDNGQVEIDISISTVGSWESLSIFQDSQTGFSWDLSTSSTFQYCKQNGSCVFAKQQTPQDNSFSAGADLNYFEADYDYVRYITPQVESGSVGEFPLTFYVVFDYSNLITLDPVNVVLKPAVVTSVIANVDSISEGFITYTNEQGIKTSVYGVAYPLPEKLITTTGVLSTETTFLTVNGLATPVVLAPKPDVNDSSYYSYIVHGDNQIEIHIPTFLGPWDQLSLIMGSLTSITWDLSTASTFQYCMENGACVAATDQTAMDNSYSAGGDLRGYEFQYDYVKYTTPKVLKADVGEFQLEFSVIYSIQNMVNLDPINVTFEEVITTAVGNVDHITTETIAITDSQGKLHTGLAVVYPLPSSTITRGSDLTTQIEFTTIKGIITPVVIAPSPETTVFENVRSKVTKLVAGVVAEVLPLPQVTMSSDDILLQTTIITTIDGLETGVVLIPIPQTTIFDEVEAETTSIVVQNDGISIVAHLYPLPTTTLTSKGAYKSFTTLFEAEDTTYPVLMIPEAESAMSNDLSAEATSLIPEDSSAVSKVFTALSTTIAETGMFSTYTSVINQSGFMLPALIVPKPEATITGNVTTELTSIINISGTFVVAIVVPPQEITFLPRSATSVSSIYKTTYSSSKYLKFSTETTRTKTNVSNGSFEPTRSLVLSLVLSTQSKLSNNASVVTISEPSSQGLNKNETLLSKISDSVVSESPFSTSLNSSHSKELSKTQSNLFNYFISRSVFSTTVLPILESTVVSSKKVPKVWNTTIASSTTAPSNLHSQSTSEAQKSSLLTAYYSSTNLPSAFKSVRCISSSGPVAISFNSTIGDFSENSVPKQIVNSGSSKSLSIFQSSVASTYEQLISSSSVLLLSSSKVPIKASSVSKTFNFSMINSSAPTLSSHINKFSHISSVQINVSSRISSEKLSSESHIKTSKFSAISHSLNDFESSYALASGHFSLEFSNSINEATNSLTKILISDLTSSFTFKSDKENSYKFNKSSKLTSSTYLVHSISVRSASSTYSTSTLAASDQYSSLFFATSDNFSSVESCSGLSVVLKPFSDFGVISSSSSSSSTSVSFSLLSSSSLSTSSSDTMAYASSNVITKSSSMPIVSKSENKLSKDSSQSNAGYEIKSSGTTTLVSRLISSKPVNFFSGSKTSKVGHTQTVDDTWVFGPTKISKGLSTSDFNSSTIISTLSTKVPLSTRIIPLTSRKHTPEPTKTITYYWTDSVTSTVTLTYIDNKMQLPVDGLFKRDNYSSLQIAVLVPTPVAIDWLPGIFTSVMLFRQLDHYGNIVNLNVTYTKSITLSSETGSCTVTASWPLSTLNPVFSTFTESISYFTNSSISITRDPSFHKTHSILKSTTKSNPPLSSDIVKNFITSQVEGISTITYASEKVDFLSSSNSGNVGLKSSLITESYQTLSSETTGFSDVESDPQISTEILAGKSRTITQISSEATSATTTKFILAISSAIVGKTAHDTKIFISGVETIISCVLVTYQDSRVTTLKTQTVTFCDDKGSTTLIEVYINQLIFTPKAVTTTSTSDSNFADLNESAEKHISHSVETISRTVLTTSVSTSDKDNQLVNTIYKASYLSLPDSRQLVPKSSLKYLTISAKNPLHSPISDSITFRAYANSSFKLKISWFWLTLFYLIF